MTERIDSEQDAAEYDPGREDRDDGAGRTAPGDNAGLDSRLAPRQMALLAALVGNPDVQAATKATGVGRTTAYRWLREPAFQAELTRQRDAVLSEALASVKTHATRAVAELAALLTVPDERLRRLVCNDILAHAMKVRELEDIERRLDALEKALKEKEKRWNT